MNRAEVRIFVSFISLEISNSFRISLSNNFQSCFCVQSMTTVTCCLNRFSGAIRSLPLSDRAIRLCNAAAISNRGRMQTTSRDSSSLTFLFPLKSMVVIRIPCGTPSFSTLPNHPVREHPFPVPEESTDRKRHHPTGRYMP